MTSPRYRSRSTRRIKKTTPGHKTRVFYKKRSPNSPICGKSKEKLHGIPRFRQKGLKSISKSKKRPNRKYGGTYSHNTVRKAIQRTLWK
jgi:large subunit ribosomal protein L34e